MKPILCGLEKNYFKVRKTASHFSETTKCRCEENSENIITTCF